MHSPGDKVQVRRYEYSYPFLVVYEYNTMYLLLLYVRTVATSVALFEAQRTLNCCE